MFVVSIGTFIIGWSIFSWRSKNVTEEL
jgi:hypothetical protein